MECGVDIAKIERFVTDVENQKFLNKFFNQVEIEYINSKSNKAQTLAGLFCAKEAFLKALGIGIGRELALKEICIIHDNLGSPQIELTPKTNYFLSKNNAQNVSISISHDGDYAVAFCVIS